MLTSTSSKMAAACGGGRVAGEGGEALFLFCPSVAVRQCGERRGEEGRGGPKRWPPLCPFSERADLQGGEGAFRRCVERGEMSAP